jgi:hypothetical protein
MPAYKFFEPKQQHHSPTKFVEFDLSTEERGKKKVTRMDSIEPRPFKALKVPDFAKAQRHSLHSTLAPKLTRCMEFNLSTDSRGAEKQHRLQE